MFINTDELNLRKFQHILDAISEEDNNIVYELEDMAISQIKTYLNGRYDTDLIFSRTGTDRNPTIKRMVLDYIVYFLFERVAGNEIPDYIKERYTLNEKMLMDFNKGVLSPDLPQKDPSVETVTGFRGGSETPFVNN